MKTILLSLKCGLMTATCLALTDGIGWFAHGEDAAGQSQYVSKEDYQKLKEEHEQLKQELEAIKAQLRQPSAGTPATNAPATTVETLKNRVDELEKKQQQQQSENDQSLDQIDKNLKNVVQKTKAAIPGTTKMLLAGYGSASFESTSRGFGPSQPPEETLPNGERPAQNNFFGSLNAIFLWEMNPRLLFEGEVELETDVGTRTVSPNLEQAQLHYLFTDNLTLSAGAFLNPMDYFIERQHMAWVNKLPDKPLAVYDGLLPETEVGAQLRGGIPLGPTKLEFAAFAAMAPKLALSPDEPPGLGTLDFDNYDVNSHIAGGGHVGFFPIPELEIGYGFQTFKATPVESDTGAILGKDVTAFLQSADLTYVKDLAAIKGTLNFHAQWVWSHMGEFAGTIDNLNALDGSALSHFRDNRNGGYAQLAYRPTKVENKILQNLEGVFRYDRINQRHTPLGMDEERYTVGLDYWLAPSTVAKVAYEIDRQHGSANNSFGNFAENGHAVWLQVAVGF